MARVGASMTGHGVLAGEGKEGERGEEVEGRGLGAAWGGGGLQGAAMWARPCC
jgi:hypothetical protein